MPDLAQVLAVYQRYVDARNALLVELSLQSNRDPLAEFSEWLVAAVVNGTLASNRNQKGWDVLAPDNQRIQVKYLANSANSSVNWHEIQISELMDIYAIVYFESLLPKSIIFFPTHNLAEIGKALGKRHGNLDTKLQFTRTNHRYILDHPETLKALGVRLFLPPTWAES